MFEATRGASVRSDIAIDDVVFERGPCRGIYDNLIIIHICYSHYRDELYILFVLLSTQNMLMTISLILSSLEIIMMIFSQWILNRKDRTKIKCWENWNHMTIQLECSDLWGWKGRGLHHEWICSPKNCAFEHLVHSWYTVSHVCIICLIYSIYIIYWMHGQRCIRK